MQILRKIAVSKNLLNNIPKTLHLYWDKCTPLSKLQALTPETFHRHNPDWNIKVYVPKQEYNGCAKYIPDYSGKDHFDLVEKMNYVKIIEVDITDYKISKDLHNILRSDILRYKILYDEGGIWSDFDIIWLKSIDHLCKIKHANYVEELGFSVTMYKDVIGHYSIGVLLAKLNHPFYKTLLENCYQIQKEPNKHPKLYNKRKKEFLHQSFGVSLWSMLYPRLTNLSMRYRDCSAIRYKTFYPYSIFNLEKLYNENDISVITNDVVCVHWFNGHELSKKYINEEQYNKECSMTTILNTML